jgi:TRAP-type C4-dicarboxylate transport system substrate-binding protein
MMNNMGGVGQGMPQGDVYSAIQTKVLDGAENNIITYVDLVQYEVAPYYNYTGHLLLPDELVISKMVLDTMSEEDQAALRKVCEESMPYCYGLCEELRAEYQAKAEEKGVTFSEADIPAFQALCQDMIQEVAARDEVTQGMYDLIVSLRETA